MPFASICSWSCRHQLGRMAANFQIALYISSPSGCDLHPDGNTPKAQHHGVTERGQPSNGGERCSTCGELHQDMPPAVWPSEVQLWTLWWTRMLCAMSPKWMVAREHNLAGLFSWCTGVKRVTMGHLGTMPEASADVCTAEHSSHVIVVHPFIHSRRASCTGQETSRCIFISYYKYIISLWSFSGLPNATSMDYLNAALGSKR